MENRVLEVLWVKACRKSEADAKCEALKQHNLDHLEDMSIVRLVLR